jgi:hypothetical protein
VPVPHRAGLSPGTAGRQIQAVLALAHKMKADPEEYYAALKVPSTFSSCQ